MRFDAPWARIVKLVSVVASAILLFVAYDVGPRVAGGWLWYLPIAFLFLLTVEWIVRKRYRFL